MNYQDNFQPVREIFACLRDGLGQFVLKEYKKRYSSKEYLVRLQEVLREQYPFEYEEQAKQDVDLQGWLSAIQRQWGEVFYKKIGRDAQKAKRNSDVANARNFLYEIQHARNGLVAHETARTAITDDDVFSLADTATRLLRVVSAKEAAAKTDEIKLEFGQKIYGSEDPITELIVEEPTPPAEPIVQVIHEPTQRIDLRGANLSKMDLRHRKLRYAILSEAKLEETNLREEELSGVRLDRAALNSSDLSRARLEGADLRRANLESAKLPNAILQRANLCHANMRSVNLEFASMQYANMTKADMDAANLRNADLRYATLTDTNLVGADLRGSNLQGADLHGTMLQWDGRDLLRRAPTKAMFDNTSILPDGSTWTHEIDMAEFTD